MQSNNNLKQRIVEAMSLVQEAGDHAAVLQTQNLMEPKSEKERNFLRDIVEEFVTGAAGVKRILRILEAIMVDNESNDAQVGKQNSNLKRGVEDEELEQSDTSKGNKRVNLSNTSTMREDQDLSASIDSETKNKPKDESEVRRSVYVTNVPYEATEAELKQAFMKYGQSKVLSLQRNGHKITTANVTFETEDATKKCLQQKEIDFQSRKMRVLPYRSKKSSGSKTIYCGDFPFNVTVDEKK